MGSLANKVLYNNHLIMYHACIGLSVTDGAGLAKHAQGRDTRFLVRITRRLGCVLQFFVL